MKLFAGLGNPGARYAGNRHNIGFMAVEAIASAHGFGPWRAKFQGLACEGRLGRETVLLLKPETFMNLSGQSVGEAMRFYKLTPADLLVFHDELDLAPGKLRLKQGGGHAGHNGLRSIHGHVGEAYGRVRLGIGHPGHKDAVAPYVLSDFAKAEQPWLEDLLRGIADGAVALAEGDGAKFQNAVALRMQPPKPARPQDPAARGARQQDPVPRPAKDQDPAARGGAAAPAAKPAKAAPAAEPPAEAADDRSPLQRLADRFK